MKKESVTLRILFIAFLILLLLIPLWMIQSLIDERQQYRNDAVKEISKGWAGPQTVAGPLITIVTKQEKTNKAGEKYTVNKRNYFLPENLFVDAEVIPESRYKGIYQAIVYKTNLKIRGNFDLLKMKELLTDPLFEESYLSLNIDDPKGLGEKILFKWNKVEQVVNPGLKDNKTFTNGIYSDIRINKDNPSGNFEIKLEVNGVDDLNFIPLGKNTNVNVTSNWNSPSFTGDFLPAKREINKEGFTASWNINNFNRQFPQNWNKSAYDIMKDKFGVKFFIPADEYQQTMRSSKYGLLIIILTFVSFFIVEVFSGKAIHPIQYMLIGLALVIFYSLLLSLSEYISFHYSYLLSASLVIGLIGAYTKSIYKNYQIFLSITGLLIMFYGFVYVILQLQDYSLLIGNIALFIVLAFIMFFTRKVNWFEVLKGGKAESA